MLCYVNILIKDVTIIYSINFSYSLTKFVSKYKVVFFFIISCILNEGIVELTYNLTRFGDVMSAPIMFRHLEFWRFP